MRGGRRPEGGGSWPTMGELGRGKWGRKPNFGPARCAPMQQKHRRPCTRSEERKEAERIKRLLPIAAAAASTRCFAFGSQPPGSLDYSVAAAPPQAQPGRDLPFPPSPSSQATERAAATCIFCPTIEFEAAAEVTRRMQSSSLLQFHLVPRKFGSSREFE